MLSATASTASTPSLLLMSSFETLSNLVTPSTFLRYLISIVLYLSNFIYPFHANLCASVNTFWFSLSSGIFDVLSKNNLIHDICVIVDISSQPIATPMAEIGAFLFTPEKIFNYIYLGVWRVPPWKAAVCWDVTKKRGVMTLTDNPWWYLCQ